MVVKRSPFGYNFLVVDSQKSPTNRHAPSQFLELVRQGTVAFLVRCAPGSGEHPAWKKRTCVLRDEARRGGAFAASRCAGWDEARNSTSPGRRTEDQRVRRRPRFSGRTGRCSNPSAGASLASRRRIFALSSAQRALLRGDVAPGFAWKKLRG